MKAVYLPFVDWMKCLGIFIIVFGHVASASVIGLTPPFNPKQLGVALFLFALGFLLARETRPTAHVIFGRLFDIYLFGLACALVMSALTLLFKGDANPSNYLPFLLGVNVLFNSFPANPTTWYIGTYVHVILLWAFLLRRFEVRAWHVVVVFAAEVIIRTLLISTVGSFVAYMAFTNWATVFLLGMYYGQRPLEAATSRSGVYVAALAVLVAGWPMVAAALPMVRQFPFLRFNLGMPALDWTVTSLAVSSLYVAWVWITFQVTRQVSAPLPVRFVARNTLLIFIVHMPLFYALRGPVRHLTGSYGMTAAVMVLVCFVLLAFVSDGVYRMVKPKQLRTRLLLRLPAAWRPSAAGQPA